MKIARLLAVAAFSAVVSLSFGVTAKLCLDPGHGGSDPGAVGCGYQEKTNNLNTALKFRDWLNADTNDGAGGGSWTVVMTRTTDVFVSLQGRCDISNNNACNRFMCNHNNACCGGTGTETFSCPNPNTTTADLRNKVQYQSVAAWGLTNRGNKTYNFYVLLHTAAPADLAELGFIDNCAVDTNYVSNATQQDKMAKYHLFAIQTHMGLAAYTPGTGGGATYTIDNAGAGFSCSANWATGTSAPDKYGADYRTRPTAAISDGANFNATVSSGAYTIQAWWSAGTNRTANVAYKLPSGTNIYVNQQVNGGAWRTLATGQSLNGSATTTLSCWATSGFTVIADAVKYYR